MYNSQTKALQANLHKQENNLKGSLVDHSPKWLQAASTEVAGTHPETPLEEDADRTKPQSYPDRKDQSRLDKKQRSVQTTSWKWL
ncbi:hypothetical protein Bca4012_066046 [Brassica carinata]